MALKDTVLYDDIYGIITERDNKSDTRFKIKAKIILPDNPDLKLEAIRVNTLNITRDFFSRFSDVIQTILTIKRYEYDEFIYPNRENLTVELSISGVNEKTGIDSNKRASKLYRFKLSDTTNDNLRYGDALSDDDSGKMREVKEIGGQLIDLDLERMSVKNISGVVRSTTVEDLIYVVMSDSGGMKVSQHTPDKTSPIGQLIIPDGPKSISLIEFPNWLQRYGGGVYNNNIGTYIYNGMVYIYPLNYLPNHKDRTRITLLSSGPNSLEGLDNTYNVKDNSIYVITSGEVEVTDDTEKLEYEYGNAVTFTKPNFNSKSRVTHDNGVSTLVEGGFYTHGEHKKTLNNVMAHNLITDNPFYEISRISTYRGISASFTWQNGNPKLIKPNTEVHLLYKSSDVIRSDYGVIAGADIEFKGNTDEGVEPTFNCNIILHCLLDKN